MPRIINFWERVMNRGPMLVLSACLLTLTVAHAQEDRQLPPELAPFERLRLPDAKGLPFVRCGSEREWTIGWVVSRTSTRATILTAGLLTETVEATLEPVDFDDFCRNLPEKEPEEFAGHGRLLRFEAGVDPALFAYWCFKRGQYEMSDALLAFAKKHPTWDKKGLVQATVDELWRSMSFQAMNAAVYRQESFPELLARWETIATILSDSTYAAEATKNVGYHKSLVEETRGFKKLTRSELASASTETRIAYWMKQLGNVNGATGDVPSMEPESEITVQLKKLGWAALPKVIEHLDDARPTRYVVYHRWAFPTSGRLVSIGSECDGVFEHITGERICGTRTENSWSSDGSSLEVRKARAQEFWKKWAEKGPASYYEHLLETGFSDQRGLARRELLRMDSGKYLPRFLASINEGEGMARYYTRSAVIPHLGKEHEMLLESLLEDRDSQHRAARALVARCDSARGAHWLLENIAADPQRDEEIARSVAALGAHLTDGVADRLAELVRSMPRDGLLEAVAVTPHPKVAAALFASLEDEGRFESRYRVRNCDRAARAIADMLQKPVPFDLGAEVPERDSQIAALKVWWRSNGAGIDWKDLARRTEDERLRLAEERE
jgi:hypothetical protein